ncbi:MULTISPECIES: plasmid mobilization relaxosome protein MobC [unclassified Commensalibacter]|uniref:plasmid mobilization relaxosome protein MobC n=1 Tax=unclassified Commensalibacter TaxID=2630218 RepID=UPI0018DDC6F8|nr:MULTISPECIES: plasmid mobilization relaxosome protein MobC [unclassified Commensalibacter]MBH9970698.1 plasmid mobilization relaxosome protein MobC [Commensalibacter sp. M0265]MBH9978055.1 plasmid mobilization relaxosome protein MobC [Commensalibacter sp. M0266]MBI0047231.1 plasmid mobilization relaxosome protein MobC [Commensalibacter sp. M0267]MBI0056889.1 plasmid mobilization relaxosome protein MobC [Commensalibacter sp. M0268]
MPKVDFTLLVALSKIDGNLNQIARCLNMDKTLSVHKKVNILLELASIEQSLGEFVSNADKIF